MSFLQHDSQSQSTSLKEEISPGIFCSPANLPGSFCNLGFLLALLSVLSNCYGLPLPNKIRMSDCVDIYRAGSRLTWQFPSIPPPPVKTPVPHEQHLMEICRQVGGSEEFNPIMENLVWIPCTGSILKCTDLSVIFMDGIKFLANWMHLEINSLPIFPAPSSFKQNNFS